MDAVTLGAAVSLGAGALATLALWRRRAGGGPATPLRALDFVALDTETTGLDPRRDALVALAVVPFVGGRPRPEAALVRLVNPRRPIPPAAQAIHGIGDADVRDAPAAAEVLPEFLGRCRGRTLVAHAAGFDVAVINGAARAAGLPCVTEPILDIGALAHALFPSWWDLSLDGLARLTEIEPVARHTADGDAVTAGLIFVRMIPLLERRGVRTLSAAIRLQRRAALIPGGPSTSGGGLSGP
jgi:DNA polymerase III epsilon subunit-like protein